MTTGKAVDGNPSAGNPLVTLYKRVMIVCMCLGLTTVAGLPVVAGNNVHSGIQFQLDFRSPEQSIGSRSVGNAINYSGSTVVNATLAGGDVEANKVQHHVIKAAPVIYPWQTNDVDVLHFPQRTVVEDDAIKVMPVAISFNNSAVTTAVQTVYLRFRWDGCVNPDVSVTPWMVLSGYSWNPAAGFGIGLNYDKAKPGVAQPIAMVPQVSSIFGDGTVTISTNVWYDLFAVVKPDPSDDAKTSVTFSLVKAPARVSSVYAATSLPSLKSQSKSISSRMAFISSARALRLGSEASSTSYMNSTSNYGYNSKCFRGDMSRVMIWDRALSEDEMWQVVSEASGVDWKLGSDDGKADEFSASEDVDGEWLVTNGWFNIHRELTETKPTWTIKCPVLSRETGKDKILEIKPILAGAAMFPVEVAVNGVSAGIYNLANPIHRVVPIKGKLWKAGADGRATITVTRKTHFEGTLALDSMALCGGWRMSGTMPDVGYARSRSNIGQTDPKTVQGTTNVLPDGQNGTPNSPFVSFAAYVPGAALATHEYKFSFKVSGRTSLSYDLPHAVLVNGHQALQVDNVAVNQVLTCDIPNDFLVVGENVFVVTNMATEVAGKALWASYSYYDIAVKGHRNRFLITFR